MQIYTHRDELIFSVIQQHQDGTSSFTKRHSSYGCSQQSRISTEIVDGLNAHKVEMRAYKLIFVSMKH